MQRALIAIALELYAFVLALSQSLAGVRTDEAKYLLDIPYPHPPLARAVLHALEAVPFQEHLWRIVLASLLIHVVWLIYGFPLPRGEGRGEETKENARAEQRLLLCGFWLLSAAVIFQSGTIMMAPITALQGLAFVWMFSRGAHSKSARQYTKVAGWIALFWLASLFTAYQAILYLPIVIAIFARMKLPAWMKIAAVGIPVVLLGLYTATNPFAAAAFLMAGAQNADSLSLEQAFRYAVQTWVIGGSLVLSALGTIAAFRSRNWPVILSILLVAAFIFVSHRNYYAILFTPLFIAGLAGALRFPKHMHLLFALHIVMTAILVVHMTFLTSESPARVTMRAIHVLGREGVVLIDGPFGHEWQYESTYPILRHRVDLMSHSQAIICIGPCPGRKGWKQLTGIATEVWVRDL